MSSFIMIPISISFGILIRSVSSNYYRWNRFAIEQDEFSFVTSSVGQCYNDERMSTGILQFMTSLAALVMTFVVYRKFEKQVIHNEPVQKFLINESRQIFVALAVHGSINVAIVSLVVLVNQSLQADLVRPYVIFMVFPYLWFIVVRSLRLDNVSLTYDSEHSIMSIDVTGNDIESDLSSVTMEDVGNSNCQILTSVNIMKLNVLVGAEDISSDCSLIS